MRRAVLHAQQAAEPYPRQRAPRLECPNAAQYRARDARVATVRLHHAREAFEPGAVGERALEQAARFGRGARAPGELEHFAAENERELARVAGTAVVKHLDRFARLERVADRAPDRR